MLYMMKVTPVFLFNQVSNVLKLSAIVFLMLLALFALLSSRTFVNYLAHRMATISKRVTSVFKEHGMEKAIVEGKISLGLLTFKVTAEDKKK